ncbi:NAD(P)-dependent dehydrogenase (short-subunit alcohol dehydrogenase family) [Amycolatopsis lexingtonensis]|uniref:NAD(P)-dependent dehydrogenase (Short-subunit alcohol dehydrogenase family) n=1 Tax=Amycolatopsis lexingtonensis TaxID=218822 RepID=A0ABR9IDE9_9PSEU|nr:SDR family NAD(P)-dependent oxidoreductase [Amycolatopsis lexingtonensis]MBE1501198.1 NAD(P)-dependent dehydrogenase (short-subunit alcohol dehydrogenase family) [Amycolatopsis lexingtonensis]
MTTYLITGAGGGLGALAARELAARGNRVVLAVRDPARVTPPPGDTEVRRLDLAELASVREFAAGWSDELDVLINNAGVMAVPYAKTADGFETHLAVNHFGPFLLTNLLLPHLTGRVVTVSSGLARTGRLRLDDLNWEHRHYSALGAYNQSKLANLLFTQELQRRLTESGSTVLAVAAHPGVARTGIDRHFGGVQAVALKALYPLITQKKPEYGALPILFAATEDVPGNAYVGPGGRNGERPRLERRKAHAGARELWELSTRLTS